jgi:hypothetical protein
MANVKITELTALTAADSAATDVLPIVDVSADATKKLAVSDLHRSVPDGTLSAPGIAFQSDLNSGLYRSGTDAIALVTNGAARIQVAATGDVTIPNRVGIGTASPGRLLEVNNDGETFIRIKSSNTGNAGIEFGDQSDTVQGAIFQNSTDNSLRFNGYNNSEAMRIDSSGKVGIGTSSPANDIHILGTTGARIQNSADTDSQFLLTYSSNNPDFRMLDTTGTTTVKLLASGNSWFNGGNVGIGTSSPTSIAGYTGVTINNATNGGFIDLQSNETAVFRFLTNGTVNNIETRTATPIVFLINTNERARIDSSGRLLVGTSSADTVVNGKIQVSANDATASIQCTRTSANSVGPRFDLVKTRSGGIVQADDALGQIAFRGQDGLDTNTIGAAIYGYVDGTPGSNVMPSRLVFSTTADASSSPTERMRIDSSGNVGIGTTSPINYTNYVTLALSDSSGSVIDWMKGSTLQGSIYNAGDNFYIEAKSSVPMLFATNGAEQMRIDSSGNVGIGTSSPSTTLHVDGTATVDRIINATTSSNPWLKGVNGSGTETSFIKQDGQGYLTKLGIGTTSPQSKASFLTTSVPASNPTWSNSWVSVGPNVGSSTGAALGLGYDSSGDEAYLVSLAPGIAFKPLNIQANIIKFQAGSSGEDVRIDSSGRVGIGTTSPGKKLTVYGTTTGEEVIEINNTSGSADGATTNAIRVVAGNGNYWANLRYTAYSHVWGFGGNPSISEAARIDSSGRLLVGTTTEGAVNADTLTVAESGDSGITIRSGSTSAGSLFFSDATSGTAEYAAYLQYDHSANNLAIGTASTERMRIDSSGRLLHGLTSSSSTSSIVVQGNSAGSTGQGIVYIAKGTATPSSGDQLGAIAFSDSTHNGSGQIQAQRDGGTWSSSSKPTRLIFFTTADGSSSPTERMRIDKNGVVNVGSSSFSTTSNNIKFDVYGDTAHSFNANTSAASTAACAYFNRQGGTGDIITFRQSNSKVGSIAVTASATSYNTSSDYRLKENVVDIDDGITRVKQLAPKRFNFIVDADTTVDGFLAHEAQTVVPEAVTGTHNEVDDDGNAVMQGIDQAKLVPLLTAALQEAIAKIETLEQRLSDAGIA